MMATERSSQSYDVAVVGGGQAGLAIGYFLKRQESEFVIFDAAADNRNWDACMSVLRNGR